jgi:hypothetical protein
MEARFAALPPLRGGRELVRLGAESGQSWRTECSGTRSWFTAP